MKMSKVEALPTGSYLIWHPTPYCLHFPISRSFLNVSSYKSPPSSLSVKLNQDKRSPLPHFLWSLAKPCSPFPNLHLPQPGTTPRLCLGRHLQPELPIPLACRVAPPPAQIFSKKVAEGFLQKEVCCQALPATGFKPLTRKHQAKLELILASSSLCIRDGCWWMQGRKLYQDRWLNPKTESYKLIRNSFLDQQMMNVWNSLP